jgi:hypothetical protein
MEATQAQTTEPLVLLAIVCLSDSDYSFGIFILFLNRINILSKTEIIILR